MDADYSKTFDKCPHCGCEERLFEALGKEAVANGTVTPEFHMALDSKSGIVQDEKRPLILGDKPIGWAFDTDICTGCGAIYAVRIRRVEVEIRLPPPQLVVPGNGNRADRRRLMKDNLRQAN